MGDLLQRIHAACESVLASVHADIGDARATLESISAECAAEIRDRAEARKGDKHPGPWAYPPVASVPPRDANGEPISDRDMVDAHNALAAERDDLRNKLQLMTGLTNTVGGDAVDFARRCTELEAERDAIALQLAKTTVLLAVKNAKLRRAVEACYLADVQFDCDCILEDEDSLHPPSCCVPRLFRVLAENSGLVDKINEERGGHT